MEAEGEESSSDRPAVPEGGGGGTASRLPERREISRSRQRWAARRDKTTKALGSKPESELSVRPFKSGTAHIPMPPAVSLLLTVFSACCPWASRKTVVVQSVCLFSSMPQLWSVFLSRLLRRVLLENNLRYPLQKSYNENYFSVKQKSLFQLYAREVKLSSPIGKS